MKKIGSLILSLFTFILVNAQSTTHQWAEKIGGTSFDVGYSVTSDASGNIYTTGYFNGVADFDPSLNTYTLTSNGGYDIFISKVDASGSLIWAKQIGGVSGNDIGFSIVTDGSSNIYITGLFSGVVDFDPSVSTYTLSSAGVSDDLFIAKLDASGNFLWAKTMGSANTIDAGLSLVVDASSNVYTTGYFTNTVDFDPGIGTYTLTAVGLDAFVFKLDASGNFVWAKKTTGTGSEQGNGIAIDVTGNLYITGSFQGTVDFDSGPGTYTLSAFGSDDVFISKMDASGNFIWAKNIGGTSDEYGNSIATDAVGNVFISGCYSGTNDFDPGVGTYTLTSVGGNDIFVSKLDASGNFLWAKSMGGTSNEQSNSIAIDASGNILTTGFFQSNVDFDPGAAVNALTAAGSNDIFVLKLDPSGNFVWAKKMSGTSTEIGYDILVDVSGNIYTVGSFFGTVDFDPGAGISNLTTSGASDMFLSKLGLCLSVPTSSISSQNNVLCYGEATGAATISVSGGSGFTYSWSPSGGSSASAIGLTAGNYSCVVTNSCVSSTTQTIFISQPTTSLSLTTIASSTLVCSGQPSTLTASGTGGSGTITYTWDSGPTSNIYIVYPNSYSIYNISINDDNGCSKTQTISVATNSLPIISVNSGAICSGESFTMVPSGAITYTYSNGTDVVTPNADATYSVSGTDANGCVSSTDAVSSVTVNALPTLMTSTTNTLLCTGETATLSVMGATSYTWSTTETTSDIVVMPTVQTTYTVEGADANGCVNTTTIMQDVSLCTGINNLTSSSNILVYPNPTNGILNIDLGNVTDNVKIEIRNAIGQIVLLETTSSQYSVIDIAHFVNGIYFVKIYNQNNNHTIKMVKQN